MVKLISRASDRLASKVLGSVDAGACYPRDPCGCYGTYKYYINCVGNCVWTSARCY